MMELCPDAVDSLLPGVDTISTVVDPDANRRSRSSGFGNWY